MDEETCYHCGGEIPKGAPCSELQELETFNEVWVHDDCLEALLAEDPYGYMSLV